MTFPNSPRLQKGAIIGVDPANPLASVVIFQYNPDTLTRTISAQNSGREGDRGEALRLKGPPQETIRLDLEIDAADQLERADGAATAMGIHPALATLEMLLYPKSSLMIANEVLLNMGMIEVVPPEAPPALFAWGVKRMLPVRITSLSVTEEAFDPTLNPIRARITVEMRVLNYQDLGLASAGGALFMAHQIAKETMASIGGAGAVSGSLGSVLGAGG